MQFIEIIDGKGWDIAFSHLNDEIKNKFAQERILISSVDDFNEIQNKVNKC